MVAFKGCRKLWMVCKLHHACLIQCYVLKPLTLCLRPFTLMCPSFLYHSVLSECHGVQIGSYCQAERVISELSSNLPQLVKVAPTQTTSFSLSSMLCYIFSQLWYVLHDYSFNFDFNIGRLRGVVKYLLILYSDGWVTLVCQLFKC